MERMSDSRVSRSTLARLSGWDQPRSLLQGVFLLSITLGLFYVLFQRIDLGRGENQLKAGFRSGGFRVAVGRADRTAWGRLMTAGFFQARELAYGLPLHRHPIAAYRRMRNLLTSS